MSSLVIVAIPAEDDYIHKISSELVPHMTLLFLGDDASKVKNVDKILDFVSHAADRSLMRFGLEVDRRGVLGPDSADVLFFSQSRWSGFETVKNFRSYLLQNDVIRTAYDSAEQFPEWQPHITLGYPATPAKPDERDYPGITYVNFDRIAVWFADFEGIEFPLKAYDWGMDVAMDNVKSVVEDILSHHGIRGMKWGRRGGSGGGGNLSNLRGGSKSGPQKVTTRTGGFRGKKLKTSGGKGHSPHADAVSARTHGQVAKKSGLHALSNKQLQEYNNRLNLEQNASRLTFQDKSKGKQFALKLIGKGAGQGVEAGGKALLRSTTVRKKIATGAAALAIAA